MFFKKDSSKNSVIDKKFIIGKSSSFAVQESYKTLRTNLMFSLSKKGCKKILITSSNANECKSTTCINLAKVISENGYRVLLLDCDLRLSCMAVSLDVMEKPGLSDVLVNMAPMNKAIQNVTRNLDILVAGTVPPNPSELIGSAQMKDLMDSLESQYDYIIIDAPPVGLVTDAVLLSVYVDGYIMVVRKNYANKDTIDKCLRDMQVSNARMLGFVMTDAKRSTADKYQNYYYQK